MHAEDFRKDLYGIVSGLQDGGYSDDMTLAAIAGISYELRSLSFQFGVLIFLVDSNFLGLAL